VSGRGLGRLVLVGGFATPARKMRPMADALTGLGHPCTVVCHRSGLDCSERSYRVLAAEVEAAVRADGEKATLVGFSRGGQFARVLAVRRPELVRALVTLGTPVTGRLGLLRPATRTKIIVLGVLGSLGVPSVVTLNCLGGGCCGGFWRDLTRPVPREIPLVSVVGTRDRTVGDAVSRDPHAKLMTVEGGHLDLITAEVSLAAVAALPGAVLTE